MFKLFVVAALVTIAAGRPGYLASPPVLYSSPSYIVEPSYASIGSIVKSIPTAVSHQSLSQVHSSAHYIQPIVAPVLKATYAAPIVKTIAAPYLHAGYAAAAGVHETPLLHNYHSGTFVKSYAPAYGGGVYAQWY